MHETNLRKLFFFHLLCKPFCCFHLETTLTTTNEFALKVNSSYDTARVLESCFGLSKFQHFIHSYKEPTHPLQEYELNMPPR